RSGARESSRVAVATTAAVGSPVRSAKVEIIRGVGPPEERTSAQAEAPIASRWGPGRTEPIRAVCREALVLNQANSHQESAISRTSPATWGHLSDHPK